MSVKTWNGTVVFIEKSKGPMGGKGPMKRRSHDTVGGDGDEEGGPPSPPSLDRPWGIARIGVYKPREAPGRHS